MLTSLLSFTLAWSHDVVPPRTHKVAAREVHEVSMRDGHALRTVIYRPKGEGTFPTVFTRSPYPFEWILGRQCRRIVRRGFACGWQEVRGTRHDAGAGWHPYVKDEADGQDAVAWIAAQPWSDGQVGWIGDSYLAGAGWTVAMGDPDGVSTVVSRVFAPPMYPGAFEDGLFRHEIGTAWMSLMATGRMRYLRAPRSYHRALRQRPRRTMDIAAVRQEVLWFRDMLLAERPSDPRWDTELETAADTTRLPVFLIGGWSDAFVESQVDAWGRLPRREQSMMVIGPWDHLGNIPSSVRLRDRHVQGDLEQMPRVIAWYAAHLKGAYVPELQGVLTYVMGGDRWEHRPDWPPATVERRFGVARGGSRCGGFLDEAAPTLDEPLTWTYNPEDPFPSRGGAGILAGAVPLMRGVKHGYVKAKDRCGDRRDVWQFISPRMESPLHIAGTIAAEMEVASSAPDSAFGFRLLVRRSNGTRIVLREGFTTMALGGHRERDEVRPGQRVSIRAETQPIEAELQTGESLELVLTSSSFPAVEAHPNRSGTLAEATDTQPAEQTVYSVTLVIPEVAPAAR